MFHRIFVIILLLFLLLPDRLLSELLFHHQAPKLAENIHNQTLLIGSKFKFFCYLQSSGSRPLHFEWLKDGQILRHYGDKLTSYTISTTEDDTLFSIDKIRLNDTGSYTCLVRNSYGSDSKTISLTVKVPPTWIVEPKDTHTNGKENVRMECKADGSPKPTIKWITSKGITIESEYLDVNKYRTANVDTYECVADNGVGEPLRKSIKVSFMVPVKFHEKFASLKVKRSESVRLECNATGDQPLTVQWTKNNVKLDKLGSNYEIIDTNTDDGIRSELFIQTSQTMTDDAHTSIYKCFVENEHGKDERTIRLEVVEVPGMPKNVHVKEVWSRTVSLSWSEPFNGNLPIQKYTVQYWRYQSAPHRLNEVFVPGSQTSFFLKDLSPGQSYELSVIAENEIGKGASSAPVTFTTGEEEPSAPPNDISLESMGPSTVRLVWRSPPIENWNGEITGYYVGYRKARDNNSPYVYITVPTSAASRDSNQAQKTRPKEITFHEYFLRQLNKGTEYSVVVKAYNSAGSGPQSHPMVAHTFDGDLPPAFQLNVIDNTEETISLQWYQKLPHSNYPQSAISGYTIHYRKENEAKWKEVPISNNNANQPTVDPNSSFNSYSFVLENLEHNAKYMIYLVAINRFGVGDPSNVITARTHNGMAVVSHEVIRRFHGANYYLEPLFLWPLLFALVIIIIVMIVAYVCIRKTRNESDNPFNLDAATLNKRLSAAYNVGTTPRYADFEKTANKTLLMSIDGQPPTSATAGYPTPYAASTPWERPLPNPQTMKKDGHIYDHPQ